MVIAKPTTFEIQAPFDATSIGTAVVCCSDGRFVGPMDEFLHQGLGIQRYDCLAVPGGAGCLAGHFAAWREEEAVSFQLKFLIEMHALHRIVLIAHPTAAFIASVCDCSAPRSKNKSVVILLPPPSESAAWPRDWKLTHLSLGSFLLE